MGAAQRAAELAQVALAVYEVGGKAIHVPLLGDHPLVSVLAAAIASAAVKEEAGGGSGRKGGGGNPILKGADEVAAALLDQVVQLQGEDGGGGGAAGGAAAAAAAASSARFARLVALHALAVAAPSVVVPKRDPQRFVRALAPYATVPDAGAQATPGARMGAAAAGCELLCLVLGTTAQRATGAQAASLHAAL